MIKMTSETVLKSPLNVSNEFVNVDPTFHISNSEGSMFSGKFRNYEMSFNVDGENIKKTKMSARRISRVYTSFHSKPQLHGQDNILQYSSHKSLNKRRYTFAGQDYKLPIKKRRRNNSVVLPTKFLLGGNINDPLNLSSLEDEDVNRRLNAITPQTSPIPVSRHRTQVKVCIPPNIYDPLNLNTGEDIEFNLITRRTRKRKRHRKGKKEEMEQFVPNDNCSYTEKVSVSSETDLQLVTVESSEKESKLTQCENKVVDKIVSPVVQQSSPSKFYKRHHSKTSDCSIEGQISKTTGKYTFNSKRFQSLSDLKLQGSDKFRFGSYHHSWADVNRRLKWLTKPYFSEKTVLDIGCNVGHFTMHIAEHFHPKRIVGIDINSEFISIAKKNLCDNIRNFLSLPQLFSEIKMPQSMVHSYGSLVKVPVSLPDVDIFSFPNNVHFEQADYILNNDADLAQQKPEYDTILCLRATLWMHLNWGDEGLKRAFKRMFLRSHA